MKELLKKENMFLENTNTFGSKQEVFSYIAEKLNTGVDSIIVAEGLQAREALSTTGFGSGIAIPHTKLQGVEPTIALFRFASPIEWEALDGEPVDTAIVLVMPDDNQNNLHLKVIATLARKMMRSTFVEELKGITDSEEMITFLNAELDA